jgi:hypothetical protein
LPARHSRWNANFNSVGFSPCDRCRGEDADALGEPAAAAAAAAEEDEGEEEGLTAAEGTAVCVFANGRRLLLLLRWWRDEDGEEAMDDGASNGDEAADVEDGAELGLAPLAPRVPPPAWGRTTSVLIVAMGDSLAAAA